MGRIMVDMCLDAACIKGMKSLANRLCLSTALRNCLGGGEDVGLLVVVVELAPGKVQFDALMAWSIWCMT